MNIWSRTSRGHMHHAVMELRLTMRSTLSPRLSHISPRLPVAVLTCSRRNVLKRRHMFTMPWGNELAKHICCVREKGEPGAAGQPLSKYCEANVSLAFSRRVHAKLAARTLPITMRRRHCFFYDYTCRFFIAMLERVVHRCRSARGPLAVFVTCAA